MQHACRQCGVHHRTTARIHVRRRRCLDARDRLQATWQRGLTLAPYHTDSLARSLRMGLFCRAEGLVESGGFDVLHEDDRQGWLCFRAGFRPRVFYIRKWLDGVNATAPRKVLSRSPAWLSSKLSARCFGGGSVSVPQRLNGSHLCSIPHSVGAAVMIGCIANQNVRLVVSADALQARRREAHGKVAIDEGRLRLLHSHRFAQSSSGQTCSHIA